MNDEKKYIEYDRLIAKSVSFLMEQFPDGKIVFSKIDLKNKNHLYWLKMLEIVQICGGKVHYSRNFFKLRAISKELYHIDVKLSLKKGLDISTFDEKFCLAKDILISDFNRLSKEIYEAYYETKEADDGII